MKRIYESTNERSMREKRKEYVQIAEDLMYDEEVIEKLRNAKTENDLIRIMKSARQQSFKD